MEVSARAGGAPDRDRVSKAVVDGRGKLEAIFLSRRRRISQRQRLEKQSEEERGVCFNKCVEGTKAIINHSRDTENKVTRGEEIVL